MVCLLATTDDIRNKKVERYGKWYPANELVGVGGVDSYDIDKTVVERF